MVRNSACFQLVLRHTGTTSDIPPRLCASLFSTGPEHSGLSSQ